MTAHPQSEHVRIELLGAFRVLVDGQDVAPTAWPSLRSAELVQILALTERHRLLRDQVIENPTSPNWTLVNGVCCMAASQP